MAHHPYLLAEKEDLSLVFSPLKTTHRIKYTCFNVSQNFLILGASSGGLYVFKREPCSFLQLLPNKEGPISVVNISPNEKLFAFATIKGTVCILERNMGPGARIVQISREHLNSEVTTLQWNTHSNELYIGDNVGRVSVINILMFMAKNMFNMPTFMLMHLDSRIVQLDWQGSLLLVSTLTRCYLCDTYKEEFRQIGQKLREGEFGACFCNFGDETVPCNLVEWEKRASFSSLGQDELLRGYECYRNVKIYCARPGSRLWEVDIDGLTVKNTHQFKEALAVEPTSIVGMKNLSSSRSNSTTHSITNCTMKSGGTPLIQQSFNFVKLYVVAKKFLFTFKSDGIYIFNPVAANVVLWNNNFENIVDCRVFNDIVYLRLTTGALHAVTFSSVEKFLFGLYVQKNYTLCAELCVKYLDYLMSQVGSSHRLLILSDLADHVTNSDLVQKIAPFLQELSKYKGEQKSLQLKSGIFLVRNSHLPVYFNDVDDEAFGRSHFRNVVRNRKSQGRSLSSSPRRKGKNVMEMHKCRSWSSVSDLVNNKHEQNISFFCGNQSPIAQEKKTFENKLYHSSELPLPFSTLGTPEAIQALKHIGHSVTDKITNSTRSLKKKWHSLEGKMKYLGTEYYQEPFDVKSLDSENIELQTSTNANHSTQLEDDTSLLVFVNRTRKQSPHIVFDVLHITQLCTRLESSRSKGDDISDLTFELFDSIGSMYNHFVMPKSEKHKVFTSILFDSVNQQFPFRHYFGDVTIKVIQETLHESLKSKLLINWIEQLSTNIDVTLLKIPTYLTSVHTHKSLETDHRLSNILRVFIELVDPNTIIECMKTSQVPCYYLSLSAILDHYEEGAFNYLKNSINISAKWPLLSLLNAMFWVFRMGQVETCLKMGESVCLKDVLYLILRLESHLLASGIEPNRALLECYKQFLTYIDYIDPPVVILALEDGELSSFMLTAFQCLNSGYERACVCGFPLLTTPAIPHFPHLADLISNHLFPTNRTQLLQLATRVPGMWHYILRHRRNEDTLQVLPLLIHAGDIPELSNRLMFSNCKLWEETLKHFVKYKCGSCLNCGHDFNTDKPVGISWTAMALMVVKSLGASVAINLLRKYSLHIPPGELDARFFQACLLTSMVDNYASGLRGNVVDLLSNPSYCQPPRISLSPNVRVSLLEAVKKDLASSQLPNSQDFSIHNSSECITTSPSCDQITNARISHGPISKLNSTVSYVEIEPEVQFPSSSSLDQITANVSCGTGMLCSSPSNQNNSSTPLLTSLTKTIQFVPGSTCHWGLSVDLTTDNCPCCTLPLVSRGLIRDGGITAFRCRHTYHTVCVNQGSYIECVLCKIV